MRQTLIRRSTNQGNSDSRDLSRSVVPKHRARADKAMSRSAFKRLLETNAKFRTVEFLGFD